LRISCAKPSACWAATRSTSACSRSFSVAASCLLRCGYRGMRHPRRLLPGAVSNTALYQPMRLAQVPRSLRTLAARPSLAIQKQGAATMYRIPGAFSAATTTPAPAVPAVEPTRGPPPGSPQALEGGSATGLAEIIIALAEYHERIALGLNDVVVHPLFTAGLDLHAALGLIGDHPASSKICHAVDELDQAIRDIQNIRDTILDRLASEPPPG
jgi:hypothetical protein